MNKTYYLNKVVFVDDDPLTNSYHSKLNDVVKLAEKVEFYETAEQMLEAYGTDSTKEDFPDLFIIDIGLPKESGHDLGVKIRELSGFDEERNRIVFVTASKDIKDVVIADNNEFEHYFWKPLDKRKVYQLLRDAFDIRNE